MRRLVTISLSFALTILGATLSAPRPAVATPIKLGSGYGNYCSKTWPDGGSAFSYVASGGDPCASMDPGAGGTTRRKGVYANSNWNNVILRCDQGVWYWTGVGEEPLASAYNEAYKTQPAKSNCVFTVSPRVMPIFTTPFFLPNIKPGNGFDFARAPYGSVDLTQYGTGTATAALVVNHKGQDLSGRANVIDDHPGHDWGLPKGTPLHAVGDGTVIRAGKYFKSAGTCQEFESDVYIKHTVCGKNNYCEQFISYYTHMNDVVVFQGQSVKRGAVIGTSGDSGCVPAHLHFSVARLSNTVHNLLETVTFKNDGPAIVSGKVLKGKDGKVIMKNVRSENLYNWLIDPYGWDAPFVDPWGSLSYGSGLGAMSIRLWRPGEAPPIGDW